MSSFTYNLTAGRKLAKVQYYTGIAKTTWDGNTYEIKIPVIVDSKAAQQVRARKDRFRGYPAGNYKETVLGAGLCYCKACGVRMCVVCIIKNEKGKKYIYYRCKNALCGMSLPGCAGMVRAEKVDTELWGRVWERIGDPVKFQRNIEQAIADRQAQERDVAADCGRLQGQLDDLTMKRQTVITWGVDKVITQEDMEYKLGALGIEELGLRRDLAEASLLVGNKSEQLLEIARIYQEHITQGADLGGADPTSEEGQRLQFEFRRKTVQGIVTRVEVAEDKSIDVKFDPKFAELCIADPSICS